MFFSVILILLIAFVFRKQKMDESGQQKFDEIEYLSKNKKELIFGLAWYIFYFILSCISCAFQVDIINELSNWIFLVFFPLLIITVFRKEKVMQTLKETGLKHFDRKTVLRILLICAVYQGIIILVFGLGEFCFNITNILQMLVKLPVFFCLMILTAAFTEEIFFRGILQRTIMNSLKQPYFAILLTSILFALYHFPFAYYLWDDTAGSIVNSLKMVMMEYVLSGCALGLIYYKSNKNLWSSIILHAKNHHLLVNIVNNKIVSSCVCVIIPNLTRNVRPYAFIENVVTNKACRGKGYATECLNYAKDIAVKENCYKMMLLTGSKERQTLEFYRNAGYNSTDKTAFIQWIDK